jgi:aspartate kinase
VNPDTKEITTIGRGGTDTTAVAMASALKASACEIVKEVDGVCAADPHLVPQARRFSEVSYPALLEMCFWGAKILHYRSVELAHTLRVPLSIHYFNDHGQCTRVQDEVKMFENQQIISINSHRDIHHFEITPVDNMASAWSRFQKLLDESQLAWPQIIAATMEGSSFRIMYTSDPEHMSALARILSSTAGFRIQRPPLSSVTMTCHGSVSSDLTRRAVEALAQSQIAVEKVLLSPLSLTLVVEPGVREKALRALHDGFAR